MIAPKNDSAPGNLFPGSRRIYVPGKIHPELEVPMREIDLAETTHPDGRIEANAPVRVYDCSGPWGDPDFNGNVEKGLPALRRDWILARGDVEEYEGRQVKPQDDGYLSQKHRDQSARDEGPGTRDRKPPPPPLQETANPSPNSTTQRRAS